MTKINNKILKEYERLKYLEAVTTILSHVELHLRESVQSSKFSTEQCPFEAIGELLDEMHKNVHDESTSSTEATGVH